MMMFTNDTTNLETIQQTVGKLLASRVKFFSAIEELEKETGIDLFNKVDALTAEIDSNYPDKEAATTQDAQALLQFIQNH